MSRTLSRCEDTVLDNGEALQPVARPRLRLCRDVVDLTALAENGKLDPDEWQLIKTHTVEGQKMLDRIGGFMHEVGLIVRSHHERWDGGGYPDRLVAADIPLAARVVATADVWDALTSARAYRSAWSHEDAAAYLVAERGRHFDPTCVDAILALLAESGDLRLCPTHAAWVPFEADVCHHHVAVDDRADAHSAPEASTP